MDSQMIQNCIKLLCFNVIKSDLKNEQMKLRVSEYYSLRDIAFQAEQYGLNTLKLREAVDLISGEVSPYSGLKAHTVPHIVGTIIAGLKQIIAGYGAREPQRVALLTNVLQGAIRQKYYMFEAIQQGVRPEKILLMTNSFLERCKGCEHYHEQITEIIANEFSAPDKPRLLKSVTAYLILLEYCKDYAEGTQNSVPLFSFPQNLNMLCDSEGNVRVVHMLFDFDGDFAEEVNKNNLEYFATQREQFTDILELRDVLTRWYIAGMVRESEHTIQTFYKNNSTYDNRTLMGQVSRDLRAGYYRKVIGSVETSFKNIVEENRRLIEKLTNNRQQNRYIEKSPLNILIEKLAHNPISETDYAQKVNDSYILQLKRVLAKAPHLIDVVTTPQFKIDKMVKSGLQETKEMDLEDDTASGLVYTMDMDMDEIKNDFHCMREERVYDLTILGQYILTEKSFLNFKTDIPVIQIERRMVGSVIVGANEAAFKLGFSANLFITNVEEVNFDEIDEFLQDTAQGVLNEKTKYTRFRLVMLGRQKQDIDMRNEQLLYEALSDEIPVLDNVFFNSII
tara:strand:- start:883 stop:2574 length:1692 start_codon:yes stop_codon:yes gene_type:complete